MFIRKYEKNNYFPCKIQTIKQSFFPLSPLKIQRIQQHFFIEQTKYTPVSETRWDPLPATGKDRVKNRPPWKKIP